MTHGIQRLQRWAAVLAVTGIATIAGAAQVKPDNTATNKGDTVVTADQQKNNRSDLETSREIRRAIVADKSLSTYAHNIKIVTRGGKVTLRGPVRTEAEKALVMTKAAAVAGADNITTTVTIVPLKTQK